MRGDKRLALAQVDSWTEGQEQSETFVCEMKGGGCNPLDDIQGGGALKRIESWYKSGLVG